MLHEIKRRNVVVFLVQMARFIWLPILAAIFLPQPAGWYAAAALMVLFTPGRYKKSLRERFYNPRFYHLWVACTERHKSLSEALRQLKRSQSIEFQELPRTVDSVGDSLYHALRKADIIMRELQKSERLRLSGSPAAGRRVYDQEAVALYQQAALRDRDYDSHLGQILGAVEQAEAQAALYISSLDSLRVQVLKHRLGSRLLRDPIANAELNESLSEAKMMLDSIDKALDELDASPFTAPPVQPSAEEQTQGNQA